MAERVELGKVVGLDVAGGAISGLRPESGEVVARDALVVAPRFVANADLLAPSGSRLSTNRVRSGAAASRPDEAELEIWVAGNVVDISAQVLALAIQGWSQARPLTSTSS